MEILIQVIFVFICVFFNENIDGINGKKVLKKEGIPIKNIHDYPQTEFFYLDLFG